MKAFQRAAQAGALVLLFGGAYFTPQLVSWKNAAVPAPSRVESDASPAVADAREPSEPGDGFTDLYGNEINDAIATYTLDPSGSLYELHSPQTELPRLGIPKS